MLPKFCKETHCFLKNYTAEEKNFLTAGRNGHDKFHIILTVLIIVMQRREVGVWILLLGRLQEAPPTKVGHDDQMPY